MVVVDLSVLVLLGRNRNVPLGLTAILAAGLFALMASVALGEDRFGVTRLAAYGLFLHGTIVLLGAAVLLWRKTRLMASVAGVTAVGLVGVAIDAFLIEPTWLEVSRITIASDKLDRPVRIVVLADLQTDQIGEYERDVFRRVVEEKPDVVLLAGDYLQVSGEKYAPLCAELNALLREVDIAGDARVFAVQGNVDPDGWRQAFDGLDVTPVGRTHSFSDVAGLRLTCLAMHDSRVASLSLPWVDSERFHVMLGHVPDFAMSEQVDADLLIAGHTHGGQVRLPLVGPMIRVCRVPRSWTAGVTELSGGRRLLVSRGVGMERHHAPRLRFRCRPELVVVDLVPEGGEIAGSVGR